MNEAITIYGLFGIIPAAIVAGMGIGYVWNMVRSELAADAAQLPPADWQSEIGAKP